MIESYDDLYKLVESTVDDFMKESGSPEIVFKVNDNKTCEMRNKDNGNKFVLMFARYGDEYKVGFALYVADQYGGVTNPEWIEDIANDEFDAQFAKTLITEHLLHEVDNSW